MIFPIRLDDPHWRRALWAPPERPESEPVAQFPLAWYDAFLREIVAREVVTLTFRDLFDGVDDWDYTNFYRAEYEDWVAHRCDPDRTYLVIQHDIDNHPAFTERMVALELSYGVRSNIFMFKDRYTARDIAPSYPIVHEFFQAAERCGFVVGYHQNAFQLAGFDPERAGERYLADVEFLRQYYDIDFVVPHGGRGATIDGKEYGNADVPMPAALEGNLRWVYNRYGAKFAKRWSDGGIRASRDLARLSKSDIIHAFLDELQPGTRNFCLVHPQRWGYHVRTDENPMLQGMPWYQDMIRSYLGVEPSGGDA